MSVRTAVKQVSAAVSESLSSVVIQQDSGMYFDQQLPSFLRLCIVSRVWHNSVMVVRWKS